MEQRWEVGNALDAEIMRRIVKAKRLYDAEGNVWTEASDRRPWYIPSGKPWRTHFIDAKVVPWFSRDIDSAWSIARGFIASGWAVMTLSCPEHDETPPEKRHTCRLMAEGITVAGDGETLPLAMCRAFLNATDEFERRAAGDGHPVTKR